MAFFMFILSYVVIDMLQREVVLLTVSSKMRCHRRLVQIEFVLVLNEINQYAHRFDEKPAHFKLADVCQPVSIVYP